MKLELTEREVTVILSALYTVSPSGGGSEPFALHQHIVQETGLLFSDTMLTSFTNNVLIDAEEAGAVTIHK